MPWKETNVMEQRVMFINAWLSRRYTKIQLCEQFNISRLLLINGLNATSRWALTV